MNLEEIEAKADEYAHHLTDTKSADQTRYYREKLEGLNHLAQIKRMADLRSEWNTHVGMREAEIDAMHKAANAAETAVRNQQQQAGICGHPSPVVQNIGQTSPEVCSLTAGHAGWHQGESGVQWTDGEESIEPTKTVADRLHELVSYFTTNSEASFQTSKKNLANSDSVNAALQGRYLAVSKAYDDAATKLQEILLEGEI